MNGADTQNCALFFQIDTSIKHFYCYTQYAHAILSFLIKQVISDFFVVLSAVGQRSRVRTVCSVKYTPITRPVTKTTDSILNVDNTGGADETDPHVNILEGEHLKYLLISIIRQNL